MSGCRSATVMWAGERGASQRGASQRRACDRPHVWTAVGLVGLWDVELVGPWDVGLVGPWDVGRGAGHGRLEGWRWEAVGRRWEAGRLAMVRRKPFPRLILC